MLQIPPLRRDRAREAIKALDDRWSSNNKFDIFSECPVLSRPHWELALDSFDQPDPGDNQVPTATTPDAPPPTLPGFPTQAREGPVGGRLAEYWRNWQLIGADSWVLNILRNGYQIPFDDELPPLTLQPPDLCYAASHPLYRELQDQVRALLAKSAIEEVDPSTPGFYSRLFLAPKKTGTWRPVIDLKALNRFVSSPKFKMETSKSVMAAMRLNTWCTSLDLHDAFMHIPVALRHRRYLRFRVGNKCYQFKALPFGLGTSPYVFSRMMKTLGSYAHSRGLSLIMYLDDWLLTCTTQQSCARWTSWLLVITRALGLLVNLPKSDLDPAQLVTFVGIIFDLIRGSATPAAHRIEKFLGLMKEFQAHQPQTAEAWQRILGHMNSMETLVPRGRLQMRPLQYHLRNQWTQVEEGPDSLIPWSQNCTAAFLWWLDCSHLSQGTSFTSSLPELTLFTDASTDGWGAHMGDLQAQGRWSTEQAKAHINNLELLAVILALEQFLPTVRDKHVLLMTDNTTVIGNIKNQGGTHSWELYLLARQLFDWLDLHKVKLTPRHIPGHLNVIADRLSRSHQVIQTEWSLSSPVAQAIWKVWGQPHVDLFATRENHKLPVFVSPLPDEMAWKQDALSISWENLWMYVYPPTSLLMDILTRISQCQCEVILVAPAWPAQIWYALLLDLCIDHPRRLPDIRTLLRQPGGGVFHLQPEILQLHAWRLSGPLSRAQATRRTALANINALSGSSLVGVLGGVRIYSFPLTHY